MTPPEGYQKTKLPFSMGDRKILKNFELYVNDANQSTVGQVSFEPYLHGPPQFVHGGAQAYLHDEVMGCTCWHLKLPVVAKKIEIEFHRPAPLENLFQIVAQVTKVEPQHIYVTTEMMAESGKVVSSGSGYFHRLIGEQYNEFTT